MVRDYKNMYDNQRQEIKVVGCTGDEKKNEQIKSNWTNWAMICLYGLLTTLNLIDPTWWPHKNYISYQI